jgi:hypothetical protein
MPSTEALIQWSGEALLGDLRKLDRDRWWGLQQADVRRREQIKARGAMALSFSAQRRLQEFFALCEGPGTASQAGDALGPVLRSIFGFCLSIWKRDGYGSGKYRMSRAERNSLPIAPW